jgi:hypothetical protein
MKFQRYIGVASKVSSAGRRATIVNNNENTMGAGRNPPGSGSMTTSNIKHLPTFARKQASARNNEITRLETTRQQHGTRDHGTGRNMAGASCSLLQTVACRSLLISTNRYADGGEA